VGQRGQEVGSRHHGRSTGRDLGPGRRQRLQDAVAQLRGSHPTEPLVDEPDPHRLAVGTDSDLDDAVPGTRRHRQRPQLFPGPGQNGVPLGEVGKDVLQTACP
jgi:hypothetical protein